MCGILGGVFRQSVPVGAPAAFEQATQTLAHRGPDDSGVEIIAGANAVLGFRRLSIIDLAAGHQPMSNDTGQHIIFNGEIYNYRDVRSGLEARGQRFRTASDTEVLLRGLALDGTPSLSRLYGMWGFAFLDVPGKRLILARDRLGIKQLYYALNDEGIFWASEPKGILALPWVARSFNQQELENYLTFRCVPSPNTLFAGIHKLPPGHVLDLNLATWQSEVQRYWAPPAGDSDDTIPLGDAVSRVEEALLASVKRRLVADVPVGALLSGGLDSSMVVAAMRKLGHAEIRTFSAVFPGSKDNEQEFSQRVATHFGTQHHPRPTQGQDFFDSLPAWIDLNDDLVADASCLPLLLVSQLARSTGTKVLLSGEGADELFAGYGSYHKYSYLRRGHRLVPTQALRSRAVSWLSAAGVVGAQDLPRVREYFVHGRDYLGTAALWGAEDIAELVPGNGSYAPRRANGTRLDALGRFDFAFRIPDDLLVRTDRATMGSSIEARVPFLDHELVELADRLPRLAKAVPGFSKVALRLVALRWGVPYQTVIHRKIGFQIPLGQWLRADLKPVWERFCREALVPGLNYKYVTQVFDAHQRKGGDYEEMLWRFGALELWYRRWILGMASQDALGTAKSLPQAKMASLT